MKTGSKAQMCSMDTDTTAFLMSYPNYRPWILMARVSFPVGYKIRSKVTVKRLWASFDITVWGNVSVKHQVSDLTHQKYIYRPTHFRNYVITLPAESGRKTCHCGEETWGWQSDKFLLWNVINENLGRRQTPVEQLRSHVTLVCGENMDCCTNNR